MLFHAAEAETRPAPRGLLYQLREALGTLPRAALNSQIAALSKADRRALSGLGVRLGAASVFFPTLLRPRAMKLRALLWAVHARCPLPPLPDGGTLCYRPLNGAGATAAALPGEAFCLAIGFRHIERDGALLVIRADALERLANEARKLARQGAFGATPTLLRLAGCGADELAVALTTLGYRAERDESGLSFLPRGPGAVDGTRPAGKRGRRRPARRGGKNADSPFAKLRELKIGS